MAFYIDPTKNHYYQPQRSIRIIPTHYLTFHPSRVYSIDTQCLHQSEISTPLFWAYINKTRKAGSNKSTSVAPFKRPHSRPWFKKLFLEMCTKRNYRSTKRYILQGLQSNFKMKTIRNYSYQLSLNESEVLVLSLNFVLTSSASTHHLIQKSTTRFTQTLMKPFHFKNQPLTIKHPTYCKPSTRISPESNSTNLPLFLEQIQDPLHNHPPTHHKTQLHLTTETYLQITRLYS